MSKREKDKARKREKKRQNKTEREVNKAVQFELLLVD